MKPSPEEGDNLRMSRAGDIVTVGPRIGVGGDGVVHQGAVGDQAFAIKWLRPSSRIADLQTSIGALAEHPNPHPAFIWPIDLVTNDHIDGFGYVMALLDKRFISIPRLLTSQANSPPPFDFRTRTRVGRNLVDAFAALHGSGLCFAASPELGNLYVDPAWGDLVIGGSLEHEVVPEGGASLIKGTPTFMAPEIGRNEANPSMVTDLYSLAVILFHLFLLGHPLEGVRSEATSSWAMSHLSETEINTAHRGLDPLFIFDPLDASNRPPPGDVRHTLWSLYPGFFRELFVTSFTTGLADASPNGRVIEGLWRRALLRLADCISECPCSAAIFYDTDDPTLPCWRCGEIPPAPVLLKVPCGTVVLSEGAVISSHQLNGDRQYDKVEAVVEVPTNTSVHNIVLRNKGSETWTVTPEGEEPKKVESEKRLGVRPMAIDFGEAQGTILRAGSG